VTIAPPENPVAEGLDRLRGVLASIEIAQDKAEMLKAVGSMLAPETRQQVAAAIGHPEATALLVQIRGHHGLAGAVDETLVALRKERSGARVAASLPEHAVLANGWNLGTILRRDSRLRGRYRLNELRHEEEIREPSGAWRAVRDVDDIDLCRWLSDVYGLDYATTTAREQIMSVANENRAHPVREWLDSLEWDGIDRLDSLLEDHFGAEKSDLHAEVGRCWALSAVARVMSPGCKVDTVPILVGRQGTRKSSTIRAMVPDVSWYSDSDIPLHHSQDQYQVLQGKWVFELGEFDRFTGRADSAKIKAYATSQVDSYRESFGRRTADRPRQVVFVGTTNANEFLVDPTGARRFWVVKTGDCSPDTMAAARDQIWAEAVVRYSRGERWLLSADRTREAADVADEFRQSDVWETRIADYISGRTEVAVGAILGEALAIPLRDQDRGLQMRVGAVLAALGWVKSSRRAGVGGKGARLWEPGGRP
jgi:putative DNA primase/helicase